MALTRKQWTWGFLGVSVLAVVLEILAIADGDSATQPWTHYIVSYIPAWLGLPAIGVFAGWLVYHFWKYYRRKK